MDCDRDPLYSPFVLVDPVIRQMVEAIVKEVDPLQVVLFGSRARGSAGSDSDVDLLIVEDEPFGAGRSRRREMIRIARALSQFTVPKDILVFTKDEVEHWKPSTNHVIARAFREGVILHG